MQCNNHIINGILFRKGRLPNSHLLIAILCGHWSKWTRNLFRNGTPSNFAERYNNDRDRYL